MKPLAQLPLVLVLTALALGGPLEAQQDALAVSRLNDLSFGIVIAGTSVTVDPSGPTAGEFLINAPKRTLVRLTFTLPELTGPSTMAVNYTGAWCEVNVPARAVAFDPRDGLQLTMPNSGRAYVWLGGRLVVYRSQPAGDYTGTLTLTVALN